MNQPIRLFPLVCLTFLWGCSEQQMSVTDNVPKDYESYAQWEDPEGWIGVKSTSNMVLATYDVEEGDRTLKFTISTFDGGGGTDLENLNRWLRQLGRAPADEAQLEKLREKVKLGIHEYLYFDLSQDAPTPGDKFLTAILRVGNRSWFFKLQGPTEELKKQEPKFKQFLASFRLQGDPAFKKPEAEIASAPPASTPPAPPALVPPKQDPRIVAALSPTGGGKIYPAGGPLPAGTPAPPSGPPPLPPGGLPAPPKIPPEILEKIKNRNASIRQPAPAPQPVRPPAAPAGGPKWTVPAGWQTLPPTSMRKGNFVIPGEGDSNAEVTVIPLNVGSGSLEANITRWARQVGITPDELKANPPKTEEFKISNQSGWYIPIEGNQQAIHMGMVDHDGQTWFFKLKGNTALVNSQKDAFQTFLKSVQF